MAIVESTTIDGRSRPCVCENSSRPAAAMVGDGGTTPLQKARSSGAEAGALAHSTETPPTFAPRKMTIGEMGDPSMPYLRLQGRWLDHAGFRVGTRVRVEVSERRLVMETVEPEELRCAEPSCPHEAKSKRRGGRKNGNGRCM